MGEYVSVDETSDERLNREDRETEEREAKRNRADAEAELTRRRERYLAGLSDEERSGTENHADRAILDGCGDSCGPRSPLEALTPAQRDDFEAWKVRRGFGGVGDFHSAPPRLHAQTVYEALGWPTSLACELATLGRPSPEDGPLDAATLAWFRADDIHHCLLLAMAGARKYGVRPQMVIVGGCLRQWTGPITSVLFAYELSELLEKTVNPVILTLGRWADASKSHPPEWGAWLESLTSAGQELNGTLAPKAPALIPMWDAIDSLRTLIAAARAVDAGLTGLAAHELALASSFIVHLLGTDTESRARVSQKLAHTARRSYLAPTLDAMLPTEREIETIALSATAYRGTPLTREEAEAWAGDGFAVCDAMAWMRAGYTSAAAARSAAIEGKRPWLMKEARV